MDRGLNMVVSKQCQLRSVCGPRATLSPSDVSPSAVVVASTGPRRPVASLPRQARRSEHGPAQVGPRPRWRCGCQRAWPLHNVSLEISTREPRAQRRRHRGVDRPSQPRTVKFCSPTWGRQPLRGGLGSGSRGCLWGQLGRQPKAFTAPVVASSSESGRVLSPGSQR